MTYCVFTGIHGEDDDDYFERQDPNREDQRGQEPEQEDHERENREREDREREDREREDRERVEREREEREREEREQEEREREERERKDKGRWPSNNIEQRPANVFDYDPLEMEKPIASIGGRIELNCNVGRPNRNIYFERIDRRPLPYGHTVVNNYLIIDNIRIEDAGTYVCTDRNTQKQIVIYDVIVLPSTY